MSRLHKKCLMASAGTHLLLLALLFISPTFLPSKSEPELPLLTFIPLKLTDEPFSGGGTPGATPPPPPAPPPTQPPKAQVIPAREPEPTLPEPKPTKKVEPEHKTSKPAERPKPTKEPSTKPELVEKPPSKKHEIKPTFDKSSEDSKALEAKARARAETEARVARARALEKLGETLSKNLSSGTKIDIPGPGGEAYANYAQVVKSKYENAWFPPDDLLDDSAMVKARVVILRDGTVKEAIIVESSGFRSLDDSVRRAVGLKFIAPFPEGTKDSERTFLLDFKLKTKRSTG